MPIQGGRLVGPRGLTQETVHRVFIEGTNNALVEGAPIIASGRANIRLQAPNAGNLITVNPNVAAEVPLGIFDTIPYADEPRHYESLVFQNNAREFRDMSQPAHSGRVRLMMVVEFLDNAGQRLPQGGSANYVSFRRYLANNVRVMPVLSAWNNTGDPAVGDAATQILFANQIGANRTALPEVTTFLASNGSYEVDLARYSPGARYLQVGVRVAQRFANIAPPMNYPASANIFWIALDGPSVTIDRESPVDWVVDAASMTVAGGGLPVPPAAAAFPNYPDAETLWTFGRTYMDHGVRAVTLLNGSSQTISVDMSGIMGFAETQFWSYAGAAPAQGPRNVLSGDEAVWFFEDPATSVGSQLRMDKHTVWGTALAAATGTIHITMGG